jgi:hypothetical protein
MISKSIGTVSADKSRRHLGSSVVDGFWVGSYSVFAWDFRVNKDFVRLTNPPVSCGNTVLDSQLGLCALTNPPVNCGSSVVNGFWVGSYSAFGDDFRVNRDCVRERIQDSAGEAVSLMLSKSPATHFLLTILESTGTLCADESTR